MDTDSYNGLILLVEASRKHKINLSLVVAETGLWANPEMHKRLLEENKSGAFYPNVRRARKWEKRGDVVGGIKLDDNTYANYAIRKAIGIPPKNNKLIGFATSHIWHGCGRLAELAKESCIHITLLLRIGASRTSSM